MIQKALQENHRHIESPVGPVELDSFHVFQDITNNIGIPFVSPYSLLKIGRIVWMALYPGQHNLWKRGGTYLDHFGVVNRTDIFFKHGIPVTVIHLNPSAPASRPGHFLGNAPHTDGWDLIPDNRAEGHRFCPVVGHALINFVTDNEKVVLLRNFHNSPQNFFGVYSTRRVIRIDDENTRHLRIVFDMILDILKIRIPEVIRIQDIGYRPVARMGSLCGRMGRITWSGNDNPCSMFKKTEDL